VLLAGQGPALGIFSREPGLRPGSLLQVRHRLQLAFHLRQDLEIIHQFPQAGFQFTGFTTPLEPEVLLQAHLFDLLPGNVRYYRRHQGRSDVIKLVRLSHWPDHVEVASARGFGDLGPRQDFQFMSDVNLRYSVLEAVFGSKR